MPLTTCPSHQTLVSFVLGKLTDDACDEIARHLESCERCQSSVVRVDDQADSLLIRLRDSSSRSSDAGLRAPPVARPVRCRVAPAPQVRHRPCAPQVDSLAILPAMSKKRKQSDPLVERLVSKGRRGKVSDRAKACYVSALMHVGLILLLGLITIQALVAGSTEIPIVLHHVADEIDGENSMSPDFVIPPNDSDTEGQDARDAISSIDRLIESIGSNDDEILLPSIHPLDGGSGATSKNTDRGLLNEDWAQEAPDTAPSQPREIVDGYEDALHLLAQDIRAMLRRSNVLVMWGFDRSDSMKDDRGEILNLLGRVYEDLYRNRPIDDYTLSTVVTSYGRTVKDHTGRHPFKRADDVLRSIGSIGSENTGVERMCFAALNAIAKYSGFAKHQRHRMVLVLVTDESGNDIDNRMNLERLIAEAKKHNARIYVFGREAVFGHQTAYVHWRDPDSGNGFDLPIDLGPESPLMLEQLLSDGFGSREDAHPSGFGPYDQCRLVKETGGRFFLLPGRETNLARVAGSKYNLDAVKRYEPFLGTRSEFIEQIHQNPLRRMIAKTVQALNPRRPEISLRRSISPKVDEFREQIVEETQKTWHVLAVMNHAIDQLRQLQPERERETSLRWQANYDLLTAQLALYDFRLRQHILTLQQSYEQPPNPTPPAPKQHLWFFKVMPTSELIGDEQTQEEAAKVESLLTFVEDTHPGTPWAARAEWERRRGLGVELVPMWKSEAPDERPPISTRKL